jgi:hypothetical protein
MKKSCPLLIQNFLEIFIENELLAVPFASNNKVTLCLYLSLALWSITVDVKK